MNIRSALRLLLAAIVVACTSGCVGTVIVEFNVDARVISRDDAGKEWQARPEEFSKPPLPTGILVAFPTIVYSGQKFELTLAAGTYGFSAGVTNHTISPLCFRFDQAKLASNMHLSDIGFVVFNANRFAAGKWTLVGSTDPKRHSPFVHPAFCFDAGTTTRISFGPDLHELFPNGTMFNVSWPEGVPNLIDRGIGNWLRLIVPIEYNGKRETLEVTLTATDSKARIVHY